MHQSQIQAKLDQFDDQQISSVIKSVGVAYGILEIVARNEEAMTLKLISRQAGITPSKAHRYVQTLCACGLLNQAHKSGRYDLGVNALRIGLSAVNRVDIVQRASDALTDLVAELETDAFITVWSDLGPTIVSFQRSKRPSVAMVGPGMAMPLISSATGMVFLAFASPAQIDSVVQREIQNNETLRDITTEALADKFYHVKESGYAYTTSGLFAGRHCAAAPILSLNDKIIAAVTLVSTDPKAIEPRSKPVRRLKEFCKFYSLPRTGYVDAPPIDAHMEV